MRDAYKEWFVGLKIKAKALFQHNAPLKIAEPEVDPQANDNHSEHFQMYGVREIINASSGAVNLQRQVELIEASIDDNPTLCVDLSRAIIETACKTILNDRGVALVKKSPSLNELVNQALSALQLVNPHSEGEAEIAGQLRKMCTRLVSVTQALGDLRNSQGFASHGPDAYLESLEPAQALFSARISDAIVHLMFHAHRNYKGDIKRVDGVPIIPKPTLKELEENRIAVDYNTHKNFNDYIDELHNPLNVFEVEYAASESFAKVDPEAYLQYLDDFDEDEYLKNQTEELEEFAADIASNIEGNND